MCGIAGFCEPSSRAGTAELEERVRAMVEVLRHRGPDDAGAWAEAGAGVALGHRRLAILDLSSEGHQPMLSADGRYVLTFNGEMYNFKVLRQELEQAGHQFRGRSDTEVMLAACCEWGVAAALPRFVGMFAFALWDRRERVLHLARDRAGEKPLYYGWAGASFLFGSELKALRAHPGWRGGVERGALALLLRHSYIPAPYSIYQGIFKLPPGCFLTLTERQLLARKTPAPKAYWSLQTITDAGLAHPFPGNEEEAARELARRLREAVGGQMMADVPLGAFLSGGLDSSTIVAFMQSRSRRPVRTFSIGFPEASFDEAPFAKAVARHLGTEHTELYVQAKELQQVIPRLPQIYDEPFADTSQIPTVLLCELARSQVTVSLSGDAGDELFGGYSRYPKAQGLWRWLSMAPVSLRAAAARGFQAVARAGLETVLRPGRATRFLNRLYNFSELLPVPSDQALYRLLLSTGRQPQEWLERRSPPRRDGVGPDRARSETGAPLPEPPTHFTAVRPWQQFPQLLQRMMYVDFMAYLPDDILVKVDRAAMSVSLETRLPFLDHRLIEFAWSLPASFKQRDGRSKWLLRQVLGQYVPPALVERPKQGFAVPIADWLRGPLRPWAEGLLAEARLRQEEFFQVAAVRRKWAEHLSGRRDWAPALWNVLMFQAWLEAEKNPNPEIRKKSEVRSPKSEAQRQEAVDAALRISDFGFRPSFGLRTSDFGLRPGHFAPAI